MIISQSRSKKRKIVSMMVASTIDYSRTGTIKNCLWEKMGEIYLKHLWLFGSWYWTLELIIGCCLGLTVSIGLRIKAIGLILFKHCGYKVL